MDFEENAEVVETSEMDTVENTTDTEEVMKETAETEESTEEETVTEEQSEEIVDTPSEETKFSKIFEISHEDIRHALYDLLQIYENQDNDIYYISKVYDDYFIYEGWFNASNIYKQGYSKDGDNVSFEGERVHMNIEYLTDSELANINEMRSNYSVISEKLAKYEAEPEKISILENECYNAIVDQDDFKALKAQDGHFELSVEQVKEKADAILLNYAKSGKVVFAQFEEKSPITVKPIPAQETVVRSRYGGLGKKSE